MSSLDENFLRRAIDLAKTARQGGEYPFGAVLVVNNETIASAFNQPIIAVDPTAHAEVLVLRQAARSIGNYRLLDATVYVTLEPCVMCVGALVHARVREVVYGAAEPKTGALVSTARILDIPQLNHRFAVTGGVLETESRDLIQQFFRDRRRAGKGDAPVVAEPDSRQV